MQTDVVQIEMFYTDEIIQCACITRETKDEITGHRLIFQQVLENVEVEYVDQDYLFPGETPYKPRILRKYTYDITITKAGNKKPTHEFTIRVKNCESIKEGANCIWDHLLDEFKIVEEEDK